MRVDGQAIAKKQQHKLKELFVSFDREIKLTVLVLQSDSVTRQYIKKKKEIGNAVGVLVKDQELHTQLQTASVLEQVERAVQTSDGVVIQLPFPKNLDREKILTALPASHDVDVLGYEASHLFLKGESKILPPVVSAMREILTQNSINAQDKEVVVVGKGQLVGAPAAIWFEQEGANVVITDRTTENLASITRKADIIVLGAGSPGLLTHDMVHDGVVIFDAGTSETGGKIVGDADPQCEMKASLFTPTPGGIGPVAVTMLFVNLCKLIEKYDPDSEY